MVCLLPLGAVPAGACSMAACLDRGIEMRSEFAVKIRHADKPLPGATVEITGPQDISGAKTFAVTTNKDGIARITNLAPGDYWLDAEYLGVGAAYHCFHVKERQSRNAKHNLAYDWEVRLSVSWVLVPGDGSTWTARSLLSTLRKLGQYPLGNREFTQPGKSSLPQGKSRRPDQHQNPYFWLRRRHGHFAKVQGTRRNNDGSARIYSYATLNPRPGRKGFARNQHRGTVPAAIQANSAKHRVFAHLQGLGTAVCACDCALCGKQITGELHVGLLGDRQDRVAGKVDCNVVQLWAKGICARNARNSQQTHG